MNNKLLFQYIIYTNNITIYYPFNSYSTNEIEPLELSTTIEENYYLTNYGSMLINYYGYPLNNKTKFPISSIIMSNTIIVDAYGNGDYLSI